MISRRVSHATNVHIEAWRITSSHHKFTATSTPTLPKLGINHSCADD